MFLLLLLMVTVVICGDGVSSAYTSFLRKSNSFSSEKSCTRTRFEKVAKENSQMTYSLFKLMKISTYHWPYLFWKTNNSSETNYASVQDKYVYAQQSGRGIKL